MNIVVYKQLGLFCILAQGSYNIQGYIWMNSLGTVAAYASVMSCCSGFRPFREITDAQHETLSTIAMDVPCYQLDCLPDEAAARLCQSTVDG